MNSHADAVVSAELLGVTVIVIEPPEVIVARQISTLVLVELKVCPTIR